MTVRQSIVPNSSQTAVPLLGHERGLYLFIIKFSLLEFFNKLSHKLPADCLRLLYFSCVHPHIYDVEIIPIHTHHILTNS